MVETIDECCDDEIGTRLILDIRGSVFFRSIDTKRTSEYFI